MASTLGPRGMSLWNAYVELVEGERDRVLLEEACRTADRLDRLDGLLVGREDEWFRLEAKGQGGETFEVQVDNALSEARQQAMALRQILGSLVMKESDDGDDESWLDGVPAALLHPSR